MNYYSAYNTVVINGVFKEYLEGNYIFDLENGETFVFEEVNTAIFNKYDLKTTACKGKNFEIIYKEIFEDLDDQDIVIFRLEQLIKIENS